MHTVDTVGHQSVADRIIGRLLSARITTVFGVHGANIEDLYDAAVRNPCITPVIAKHEFTAGAMADGLVRIGGGVGAVLTTSGGGALNVLPALGEAYDSRVPVLALIGFKPDLGPIGTWGLELERNSIRVNSRLETNLPKVYAAGDIAHYEGKIELIATGQWFKPGIVGPEALPSEPFLDLLDQFGAEWEWEDYEHRAPKAVQLPV